MVNVPTAAVEGGEGGPEEPAARADRAALLAAAEARALDFAHPRTGERMAFAAVWPDDMAAVVEAARVLV